MAGKGSKSRPLSVSYEEYSDRYDHINFKKRLTPSEWATLSGLVINPACKITDPASKITEEEFNKLYGNKDTLC